MILRVADEAWIATALLHREHPQAEDFSLSQIRERANVEFHDKRPGLWYHIVSHCVASKPPMPAQYRMLHETGRGKRRLYRAGDPCHPKRRGKIHPDKEQLPDKYRKLVDWYAEDYSHATGESGKSNSPAVLMRFIGTISAFDLQRMSSAISAGCERVDPNEW
jgi:hypothetical protein